MNSFAFETHYLGGEGRQYMEECINVTFSQCLRHGITKIIMFSGSGEGPLYALQNLLPEPDYSKFKIIVITPPAGRVYNSEPANPSGSRVRAGILNPARRLVLQEGGIAIHSAHLPLKGINGISTEWTRIADAFGILGGGFALCAQAVMMACDAGEVDVGERVVALTADTSIVVLASRTETFLSEKNGLLVEHIICRPARYNISKHQHMFVENLWSGPILEGSPALGELPESSTTSDE